MTAVRAGVPEMGEIADPRSFGPISRTDIVRYQGASGDFNPLHHDDEYARAAGHAGALSVGMFQAALLATFVTDWLGAERIRRFGVRFRGQVWPGDVLECSGVVSAVSHEIHATLVDVDLTCSRQTGEVALTGTARFEFPATADAK